MEEEEFVESMRENYIRFETRRRRERSLCLVFEHFNLILLF